MIHQERQLTVARSRFRQGAILAVSTLVLGLSSCDSGGKSNAIGGGTSPIGPPLAADFGLRKDLHFGRAFVGDLLHVDLNQDGIADLVQTSFLRSSLTIALGNADGTFTEIVDIPTVGHAFRLASGDFGGDGMVDIAVATTDYFEGGTGQPAVQVFEQGPALGQFAGPGLSLALPVDPKDLATAPITGVAGDPGPDEIFLALRDADEVVRVELSGGALVQTGSLDSSGTGVTGGPTSVAVVDIGADGWLDLVVGEEELPGGNNDRVVQYPRTQAGFLAAGVILAPVFQPVVDNAGDLDSNGFDDLAVAQRRDTRVYVLAGDVAGFSQAHSIEFGGHTTSLIFTDLDGDGLAEAVGTVFNQESIQVHPALADFVWDEAHHYNVGSLPRAIGVVELPGDTIPDLLCGTGQDISVLVGVGEARFRGARGYSTDSFSPVMIRTADLDNDGDMDAVAVSREQRTVTFLEGTGTSRLEARVVLPFAPTTDDKQPFVGFLDLDNDGSLDVLSTVYELDEVRIYRNPGAVDQFTDPLPNDNVSVGDGPIGLDIADVDADGMLDVVVANHLDETIQVLLNDGNGELVPQTPIDVGFAPEGMLCVDLDNDDDVDVVAGGATDPKGPDSVVVILESDGGGGLSPVLTQALDGPTNSVVIGDFNKDELPDVAIGQTSSALTDIFVLINLDNMSFSSDRLQVDAGPANLIATDVDNDSNTDLIVITTVGELKMVMGDGLGGFPEIDPVVRGELATAHGTISVDYADMNGDDLNDLVMVTRRSPFVWVGLNTSVPIPTE